MILSFYIFKVCLIISIYFNNYSYYNETRYITFDYDYYYYNFDCDDIELLNCSYYIDDFSDDESNDDNDNASEADASDDDASEADASDDDDSDDDDSDDNASDDDALEADTSKDTSSKTGASEADPSNTDASEADPSKADPSKADNQIYLYICKINTSDELNLFIQTVKQSTFYFYSKDKIFILADSNFYFHNFLKNYIVKSDKQGLVDSIKQFFEEYECDDFSIVDNEHEKYRIGDKTLDLSIEQVYDCINNMKFEKNFCLY